MFNTLQNFFEKLAITGYILHWACMVVANPQTLVQMSAFFWLTISHQQLGQHCFCVVNANVKQWKRKCLQLSWQWCWNQTPESVLRNPPELHTILRTAKLRKYFHFSHYTLIYNIYTCIYMHIQINYRLAYTEIWDPLSYES